MTQQGQFPPPPTLWAQRKDILYITICLGDCKCPTIDISPEKIYFKGVGGREKNTYEVTIDLYKEVHPDTVVQNLGGRCIELILAKKNEGPYWPRLTKDDVKTHWLKCDFNKWKDEDDSDDEGGFGGGQDLEEMMQRMGGLGSAGDSKPNFDDLDDADNVDSDDEEMPDLE